MIIRPRFEPVSSACIDLLTRKTHGPTRVMDGCSITDFLKDDIATLHGSTAEKLFILSDDGRICATQDYPYRRVDSSGQERRRSPRLSLGETLRSFKNTASGLELPHPVPDNRYRSMWPDDLPEQMRNYCQGLTQEQPH